MSVQAIILLLSMAYRIVLRGLLKAAIDDPEQEWDELVLKMMDALFSYEEED